MVRETLVLTVEADVPSDILSQIDSGSYVWNSDTGGVPLEFTANRSEEGEGFGLTETLTVVVSIGSSVASDLIADAVRRGLRGVIRRVRVDDDQSDGSAGEIAKLIDRQRGAHADVGSRTGDSTSPDKAIEPQETERDM